MTVTEGSLLAALRSRHASPGNGGAGRYAFLTHVRTGAAWEQQEIDAIAVALWLSEYHDVHAFEVKCTRADWLREIKPTMDKSTRARELCDTFTIVAPGGVVRRDELPLGWGLIEAAVREDGKITLRQSVKPARLTELPVYRQDRALPRGFVVAMLRATGAVPGMTSGLKRARP